jgi:hypothetical protein
VVRQFAVDRTGMYRKITGVQVGEYASLAVGILIYILARRRMSILKANTAQADRVAGVLPTSPH